ncbi:hypothetical protein [Haliangium sp.]|uniref:hypothetical protein n=1 Tax=Haliangium sp. TaxID=2663208 RepID=UPI003D11D0B2
MIDLRDRRPVAPPAFGASRPRSGGARRTHDAVTKARKRLEELVKAGDRPPGDDDFPTHWKKAREPIAEAQYHKCAFCETRIRAGYPGDVDHYRPKAAVTPVTWDASTKRLRNGAEIRPGYWWLAYSFENFVFSCSRCNNHKRTRFAVRGRRIAVTPDCDRRERPTLLNPFLHDPHEHLDFDETGGVRGQSLEGRCTVYICGLDREHLTLERRRVATALSRDIDDYEDAVVSNNELAQRQTLRRLLDACEPDAPYAALARAIIARRLGLTYRELSDAKRAGLLG